MALETVAALGEAAFFDEQNISVLEAALSEQVSTGKYLARANRGLLKLYALFPARANVDNTVLVLIKALTALPAPDFLLALYLVPSNVQEQPAVAALVELERSLQTAQFAALWERAAAPEVRAVLDRVPGVDASLRAFIASVMARTYSKLDVGVARAALNFGSEGEVVAYATQSAGWAQDEQGALVLPVTPDNSARGKGKEAPSGSGELGLKYSEVAGLVASLGRQ